MKLMNGVALDGDEPDDQPGEIDNVKKRLQLLYPGNHELKIYKELEISMTLLKINLMDRSEFARSGQEPDRSSQGSTYQYALN
jgi:hypothetical protein